MRTSVPSKIATTILDDYIRSGKCKEGERLPTVRALQDRYSISRSSIMGALDILQAQGLILKRHGSGCYVSGDADTNMHRPPDTIGLIVGQRNAELVMRIHEGVDHACRVAGYHVLLSATSDDYLTERQQVHRMANSGCRAIVLNPTARTRAQLKSDYLKSELQDFPIVLVDMATPEQGRTQVVFDNYRVGFEMTEMLIDDGIKRVAIISTDKPGDLMHFTSKERYRGYLDALKMAGLEVYPEDHWVIDDFRCRDLTEDLTPFLARWRKQSNKPTAIITLEDRTAIHVISIARELGINVPDELRVVGFDNLAASRSFSPPFTTTNPDFVRAGSLAAELAMDEADGKRSKHMVYMLPVPIMRRGLAMVESAYLPARRSSRQPSSSAVDFMG